MYAFDLKFYYMFLTSLTYINLSRYDSLIYCNETFPEQAYHLTLRKNPQLSLNGFEVFQLLASVNSNAIDLSVARSS